MVRIYRKEKTTTTTKEKGKKNPQQSNKQTHTQKQQTKPINRENSEQSEDKPLMPNISSAGGRFSKPIQSGLEVDDEKGQALVVP